MRVNVSHMINVLIIVIFFPVVVKNSSPDLILVVPAACQCLLQHVLVCTFTSPVIALCMCETLSATVAIAF